MGKIKIDSGFKDYELKVLIHSPKSPFNVIHAEHNPSVLFGHKYQSKYLLVSKISNDNSKEIGRLNFDENTPVYYDYQRFKSFSGKTRILPPKDKHAIIVDLASEADFEAVTQWLIENKRDLEAAFSQLYQNDLGNALKGGIVNFQINSNEFELDSLRVYSFQALDSVKTVSQVFWDKKNVAQLYIDRNGDVVPQDELRDQLKKYFKPQTAEQKDFHSVAQFLLDGKWLINDNFETLSPEEFFKITETLKNKKGEDIFGYFERVKKTIGFIQ